MDFRHLQKRISYILVICMLFFGMCSTGVDGHSLFASQNALPDAEASLTASTVHAPRAVASQQIYTHETTAEHEMFISPKQAIRRIISRVTWHNLISFLPAAVCVLSAPTLSSARIRHFHDLITINKIIISYIHKQDGDKHRVLPA